jgi:hypothetical protein
LSLTNHRLNRHTRCLIWKEASRCLQRHHRRWHSTIVTKESVPSLDDVLYTIRKTWRCFMRTHALASFFINTVIYLSKY